MRINKMVHTAIIIIDEIIDNNDYYYIDNE